MSAFTRELLKNNKAYAATYTKDTAKLPVAPVRQLAVISCMDARVIPEKILGLKEGDAHVIRNGGGRAKDAIRSLVISEQLLETKEIIVLHHTDCGFTHFKQEMAVEKIKEQLGQDASSIDFLSFTDVDQSVKDDLHFLRKHPLIPDDIKLFGGVYHVEDGSITEVKA